MPKDKSIMGHDKVLVRDETGTPINGFSPDPDLTSPTFTDGIALITLEEVAIDVTEWTAARFYFTESPLKIVVENEGNILSTFIEPADTAIVYLLTNIATLYIANNGSTTGTLYLQGM